MKHLNTLTSQSRIHFINSKIILNHRMRPTKCNIALICRGGSRAAATSKMERFVIIVNGWKPLTIIAKHSILDVAAVLDPPLICYFSFDFFFVLLIPALSKFLKDVKVIKEAGINNISRKFLKESVGMLAIPLTQICNLSLKLSYFTNSCKLEFRKPLYKKGSKTDPKNPCQISLRPIASQIIEKIIQDETMKISNRKQNSS